MSELNSVKGSSIRYFGKIYVGDDNLAMKGKNTQTSDHSDCSHSRDHTTPSHTSQSHHNPQKRQWSKSETTKDILCCTHDVSLCVSGFIQYKTTNVFCLHEQPKNSFHIKQIFSLD